MFKNIVVIDDDKSEICNEDLVGVIDEKLLEWVLLFVESFLKVVLFVCSGKNLFFINCFRVEKGVVRVVNIIFFGYDVLFRFFIINVFVLVIVILRIVCVVM